MRKVEVAPSLLAVGPDRLLEGVELAKKAGCAYVHFDVMDGHFVPNVSFGEADFAKISHIPSIKKDVHVMVEEPWVKGPAYGRLGADVVTFHLEACPSEEKVRETIDLIRKSGAKPGISIKPATPIKALEPYLDDALFLILVMSVEPGRGGQAYIEESTSKIRELRDLVGKRDILIEVDGGINGETGKLARDAGADIMVAGTYLYGHDDFEKRVRGLENGL